MSLLQRAERAARALHVSITTSYLSTHKTKSPNWNPFFHLPSLPLNHHSNQNSPRLKAGPRDSPPCLHGRRRLSRRTHLHIP